MGEQKHYAVCVRNDGYEGMLDLRKIYEVLIDSGASARNHLRVIDESGEDYLYPDTWFVALELPRNVESALLQIMAR